MRRSLKHDRKGRIKAGTVIVIVVAGLIFCSFAGLFEEVEAILGGGSKVVDVPAVVHLSHDRVITMTPEAKEQIVSDVKKGDTADVAYVISEDGTTVYAKNGNSGSVEASTSYSDAKSVFQYAVDHSDGGIIFYTAGKYMMKTGVTLKDDMVFMGEGIGKTIFMATSGYNTFNPFSYFGGVGGVQTNFYMTGITYDGNYQGMSSAARNGVIYCDSMVNCTIENCEFKNEAGTQVLVANSGHGHAYPCRNVMIRDNIFTDNNARVGAAQHNDGNNIRFTGMNVSVLDNVITDGTSGSSTGADMNIDDSIISGNKITGCRVGTITAAEFANHGNVEVSYNIYAGCNDGHQFWADDNYKVSYVTIDSNTFDHCIYDITGSNGTNSVETNSISTNSQSRHVDLHHMNGYQVSGCTITSPATYGIVIKASSNIEITGTTVKGAGSEGMYLKNIITLTITGCTVVDNGKTGTSPGIGIYQDNVYYADTAKQMKAVKITSCHIYDDQLTHTQDYGIYITNSNQVIGVTISGNTFSGNVKAQISSGSSIVNLVISSNSGA